MEVFGMKPRKSSIYADFRVSEGLHKAAYRKLARGRRGVGKAIRAIRARWHLPVKVRKVPRMPVRCLLKATESTLKPDKAGCSDAET